MKLQRTIFSSLVLALLFGALPYHGASAQSPELKAARESVSKSVEKSAEEKFNNPELPVETIETRRATLLSVLDLTRAELSDAISESKLGGLVGSADTGLSHIADQLVTQLRMYQEYVVLVRGRVSGANVTMDELKIIATELKAWREVVYAPAIRQAFNALLVAQGAEVLSTAQRRLVKVAIDVNKLQLAYGRAASTLPGLLQDAHDHIASAAKYAASAHEALLVDQRIFLALDYEDAAGSPHRLTLRRGSGDFSCQPGTALRTGHCELVFVSTDGVRYMIKSRDASSALYAVGDVSSVTGTALIFTGATETVGLLFIESVNLAQPHQPSLSASDATASVLNSLIAPTVQALIKKELEEINEAYKSFFAMSRLAKKLIGN